MKLKRNMSGLDQLLRSLMGLSLIYFGPVSDVFVSDFLSSALMGLVGVFTLFSAVTSHCSIYSIAGINTYKNNDSAEVD